MFNIFNKQESVLEQSTIQEQISQQEAYLEELKSQQSAWSRTLEQKIKDQQTAILILERDAQLTKDTLTEAADKLKDEISSLKREKATLQNNGKIAEED